MLSRRHLLLGLPILATAAVAANESRTTRLSQNRPLRIRTITAGVELENASQLDRIERAVSVLQRGRKHFEEAGYEVQTTRVATNPFLASLDAAARDRQLPLLEKLDQLVSESGVIASVGPVIDADRADDAFGFWAAELVRRTRSVSFSANIASESIHPRTSLAAARAMVTLSTAIPNGLGNFRFAAAANIPAGTPFFPVAWHRGAESIAIGVESAAIVEDAFREAKSADATRVLRETMTKALRPIETLAQQFAQREGRDYLGIDSSPAPLKDRSIAAAIEALIGGPFGTASTLEACSIITAAIKSLDVKTCGYSGLMLPVLEDPVLAQRAGEGRFGIRDLLLYSSVCGTGLDVVPIPGDTPVEAVAGLLRDVAALSVRLKKALSARLFLVPEKRVGEIARFTDPLLTDCTVMKLD